MEDIRKLLVDELGSSKMDLIEQYVHGEITRLSLAGEIGSSYMDLVDVYKNSILKGNTALSLKGK